MQLFRKQWLIQLSYRSLDFPGRSLGAGPLRVGGEGALHLSYREVERIVGLEPIILWVEARRPTIRRYPRVVVLA